MIKRETQTIDAEGKILGRLATGVSLMLRGKDKVDYNPREDKGANVIIKNVDKMKFTGRKLEQKVFKHHTNFLGHLRSAGLKDMYAEKPEKVFTQAVYNMLPKNKLRDEMIKRLKFA
ncbi:MAG TPA: 50S ribosomal protein L13 [bacterium]|nr:50S ribosomal protein L13 [bacterium]